MNIALLCKSERKDFTDLKHERPSHLFGLRCSSSTVLAKMILGLLRKELFQPPALLTLRHYKTRVVPKPIPETRGACFAWNFFITLNSTFQGRIQTVSDFLTAIGRSSETKLQAEDWSALWSMGIKELKEAGLDTKDRRYAIDYTITGEITAGNEYSYILWCLNKYRAGEDPQQFAHPEKPKKKIRG
jgi:hypothetical protein